MPMDAIAIRAELQIKAYYAKEKLGHVPSSN